MNRHARKVHDLPYIRDGTSTIREPTRCVKGPDAPLMDGTSKNREPTRSSVRQRARSGSARTTRVQQCGAVPSTGNINITRVEVERGSGSQHARTGEMYCIVSRQKGLPLLYRFPPKGFTAFAAIAIITSRHLSLYNIPKLLITKIANFQTLVSLLGSPSKILVTSIYLY